MSRELIFGAAACAAVLSGTIVAFTVTGSPGHQRALALDARRVDDIEHIASLLAMWYEKDALPRTLPADIERNDPVSHAPYQYHRLNAGRYQLCAHFDTASPKQNPYHHAAGRFCFTLNKKAPLQ